MSSKSKFGRWLFLNWTNLYLKSGVAVWLTKAAIDTKHDLDDMTKNQHYIKNDILPLTGYNLLYYSPNVLFWPVNFAVDGYQWGVIKYYDMQSKK